MKVFLVQYIDIFERISIDSIWSSKSEAKRRIGIIEEAAATLKYNLNDVSIKSMEINSIVR